MFHTSSPEEKRGSTKQSPQTTFSPEVQAWLDSIEVHRMPDAFLPVVKSSSVSKMAIVWIIVSFVIASLVAVALYIFFTAKQQEDIGVVRQGTEGMQDTSLILREDKDGGTATSSPKESQREEIGGNSLEGENVLQEDDQKSAVIPLFQGSTTTVTTTQEETVREDGQEEDGGRKNQEETSVSPVIVRAQDSDADGLFDPEESLYGTDLFIADSDGDGFSDGAEVLQLYDPSQGEGARLEDSPLMQVYENKKHGYRVLFPRSWSVTALNADQTEVMFRANDGSFFQIVLQRNESGIATSEEWFRFQFPSLAEQGYARVQVNGREGIRASDGRIYYFVDENFVLTIQYHPSPPARQMSYLTTFRMFVRSFVFVL